MKKRTVVIGVTGGIGAGKTTTAAMFARLGAAVFDADACVGRLLCVKGPAFQKILKSFPFVRGTDGRIDKDALRKEAFRAPASLEKLEKILHPFVWREARKAINGARKEKRRAIVLDVPLLFETKGEGLCDKTVCVYTDAPTQRKRALAREGMTAGRLKAMKKRQMPQTLKKKKADVLINAVLTKKEVRAKVKALWKQWVER